MSHGNVSMDDQVKAKKKAIANLKKDPLHYYHLISGGSSKVDKHDKEVEVKRGALEVDTFNGMKKATLKEAKLMTEGTRALIGYLSGDRLTTTYNHYDGYPSNLGKGLEAHYNDDDKAKEVAMKGYITYLNPETGEIEATHNDAPTKIKLPDEAYEIAKEIAEEIDSMGADYGYIWDDQLDKWATIKNTGIRSMIDQIIDKLVNKPARDMDHAMTGINPDLYETEEEYLEKRDAAIKQAMGKDIEEIDTSLDPYEDKKEIIRQVIELIKSSMPADNEQIKAFIRTHYDDIINLGDDQAILDEFQEFLSVNYPSASDFMNEETDDEEILAYIADTYIQNAKDGDRRYADFLDLNIRDAVQDVLGILQSPDHPLHDETKEEYSIVKRDKARGLFEKKGKDHDGDGDIDGDDYMAAKDKAIKKATGKTVAELNNENPNFKILKKGPYLRYLPSDDIVTDLEDLGPKKSLLRQDDIVIYKTAEQLLDAFEDMYYDEPERAISWADQNYDIVKFLGTNEVLTKKNESATSKKSNVNEAVKNIITKILEEQTLNEAATNELARIADEYGSFEGLKPAVIALENIVTEIESFYDKTRAKIQKVYDDLGEVRNDEGLKVGAFIAPSIENAFVKDLKHITKQQFHGGLEMPKVKRISQADVDKGYIQQEAPKTTVFTPVNEKRQIKRKK